MKCPDARFDILTVRAYYEVSHGLIFNIDMLQTRKKRSRSGIRIDRSMIGLPTDFQHTIHIGSNDIELNNTAVRALQNHMQSKGGYETSYTALKVR